MQLIRGSRQFRFGLAEILGLGSKFGFGLAKFFGLRRKFRLGLAEILGRRRKVRLGLAEILGRRCKFGLCLAEFLGRFRQFSLRACKIRFELGNLAEITLVVILERLVAITELLQFSLEFLFQTFLLFFARGNSFL